MPSRAKELATGILGYWSFIFRSSYEAGQVAASLGFILFSFIKGNHALALQNSVRVKE